MKHILRTEAGKDTVMGSRRPLSSSRQQTAAFNSLVASSFVVSAQKETFADNTMQPRAITFKENPDRTSWGISVFVSPSRPRPVLTAVFAKSQTTGEKFESACLNKTHSALMVMI